MHLSRAVRALRKQTIHTVRFSCQRNFQLEFQISFVRRISPALLTPFVYTAHILGTMDEGNGVISQYRPQSDIHQYNSWLPFTPLARAQRKSHQYSNDIIVMLTQFIFNR